MDTTCSSVKSINDNEQHRKDRKTNPHFISQLTLRHPQWCYIQLQHMSAGKPKLGQIDEITAHLHLDAALSQFLGLHGSAIRFDILKIQNQNIWIKLAADDRKAFIAAVGGWVSTEGEGWSIKGTSSWSACAMGRDGGQYSGQDLFVD
jgi:ribonuclease P/MRP protein subunit POP8